MVDQQRLLDSVVTMKGKRTKRSRTLSPLALARVDTENEPRGGENSSDGSVEWGGPTVNGSSEEEDMAHCLMLLAQGSKMSNNQALQLGPTKSSNNYDCKTCNKSFLSFQALGGHRASHKKTKLGLGLVPEPNKSSIFNLLSDRNQQLFDHHSNQDGTALSLHITNSPNSRNTNYNNNKVAKVHECSICGAEFSSGQALGGHMRRHRPIGGTHATTAITNPNSMVISASPKNAIRDNQEIKTQNFLSLDLNLPAPEDDHHNNNNHHHQQQQQQHEERDNSKFVFPLNGKTLIFSASSLVDCHY